MTAIYARQSVERKASISIEMQVETCQQRIPREEPHAVYIDRGYSGTNTDRPQFQQMLEDIQTGQIQSVYVYKLDRISRSLCDFAGMMQVFRSHGVTLHSCRESFDTQTEIGGMLLNLLMMFAELEQKTIAGRVRDNYYARAEQHLPLGGIPPYGYQAITGEYHGRKTTFLQENPTESGLVRRFYHQYGLEGMNLEQLVHQANQEQLCTRQGALWSNSAVLRILRSPVYVQGNLSVVRYFQQAGGILVHDPEAYCNENGALIYGDRESRAGRNGNVLKGAHIAAGLHQGLIDASLWLAVQERLHRRGGSRNGGTGKRSWLQGCVVCGLCGEHCYVRGNGVSDTYTYFVCRGKRLGICPGIPALRIQPVEKAVEKVLSQRAAEVLPYGNVPDAEQIDPLAVELEKIENKMRKLFHEMTETPDAVPILRQELQAFAEKRKAIVQQMQRQQVCFPQSAEKLWKAWWQKADLTMRREAACILLREVRVYGDHAVVEFR